MLAQSLPFPHDPTALVLEIAVKLSRGEIKHMIHVFKNRESVGSVQILLEFPSLAAGLAAKDCLEMLEAMIESERLRDGDASGA